MRHEGNASLLAYMIGGGECAVWSSDPPFRISQSLKCLLLTHQKSVIARGSSSMTYGRCDFMDKMAINIEKHCAIILLIDDVVLEDLVVQCPWRGYGGGHVVDLQIAL